MQQSSFNGTFTRFSYGVEVLRALQLAVQVIGVERGAGSWGTTLHAFDSVVVAVSVWQRSPQHSSSQFPTLLAGCADSLRKKHLFRQRLADGQEPVCLSHQLRRWI